MISHQNALTFIHWCGEEFGLRPGDRVSSHAPLHFDLSIFDIFVTIAAGATVYLVPEEYSVFPRQLCRFVRDSRLTVWYSVPSALVQMLLHGDFAAEPARDLRLVLFAGEAFPVKYLRNLAEAAPNAAFYNLYGPTETNVCTYHRLTSRDLAGQRPVPIGRPCANTEVFIVDGSGNLVTTPGVPGELWVRGSAVAQGYWEDPAKTQAAFVVKSTPSGLPEILYRTGDIALHDEAGNLHLKGRADHMVKSRGYRIELGEIESVLYAHPAIKEAVVVAIPDELITNRLRAAIVLMEGQTTTERDIKRYLSERLPAYMIPDDIRVDSSLPKTSTGKIDRGAVARS
jgi:acyl-CoA synthetase (AMP-forming)/AMP-acid ligase II